MSCHGLHFMEYEFHEVPIDHGWMEDGWMDGWMDVERVG